jgi:hypothetical protein
MRGLGRAADGAAAGRAMRLRPPLFPFSADVADTAPSDSVLTVYNEQHIVTYLRMLDADRRARSSVIPMKALG